MLRNLNAVKQQNGAVFVWRPLFIIGGQVQGVYDPTTNIIWWRYRFIGPTQGAIQETGRSTDSITLSRDFNALGVHITDFQHPGILIWRLKTRNFLVADRAFSHDSITAPTVTDASIKDICISSDVIVIDSYILGLITDLGGSSDHVKGSPTGVQDTGVSTDTIRPGGYQFGRVSDLGLSDDRVVGIYKVTIEDAGSSADKITVRGGRSLTCDSGNGVVTLEETNYVF